jgi:hypothetical protein
LYRAGAICSYICNTGSRLTSLPHLVLTAVISDTHTTAELLCCTVAFSALVSQRFALHGSTVLLVYLMYEHSTRLVVLTHCTYYCCYCHCCNRNSTQASSTRVSRLPMRLLPAQSLARRRLRVSRASVMIKLVVSHILHIQLQVVEHTFFQAAIQRCCTSSVC